MDSKEVALIIFTCEGREHLLLKSFASFIKSCENVFACKILAIDGKISLGTIDFIAPDEIIQSPTRKGYVSSIVRALKNVETDYFFWLEDDFIFNKKVPLDYMLSIMVSDKSWAGIFLSRIAPLTEKKVHLFDDLYVPDFGFSVSPALCNTAHVRSAFDAIIAYPKNQDSKYISFEPFLDEFFVKNKLKYAIIDPGEVAHVNHVGLLESTAREYHMINSLSIPVNAGNVEYISGLKREKKFSLYNKVGLFIKLYAATIYLSVKLFFSREAYDFAFRIYIASLKRFKH